MSLDNCIPPPRQRCLPTACLSFLLATTTPLLSSAHAQTAKNTSPTLPPALTKAAVTYLQLLAKGDIDLLKQTALSPHCGIQKQKTIRKRLDFLRVNHFRKGDTFTPQTTKIDAHLAGVLVRADNPSAPLTTHVHAVAIIKTKDGWKPAPLPGRFSNTGYGYDEKIERSVSALERWMARKKIILETRFRSQASSKLISEIADIEKNLHLQTLKPEQTVELLIEKCRQKNLIGVLSIMGAASNQLPDPLETTLDLVTKGLANKDPSNDWHLLTSRSVIAQTLKIDHTRNEIAVGFHSPLGQERSKILYFPIHKENKPKGKTFARLSPLLHLALLPENESWQQRWRHRRGDENDLRKQLLPTILKNSKSISYPTARQTLDHLLLAIDNNNYTDCIRLLPRTGAHFGKEASQINSITSLDSLWRQIHHAQPLERHDHNILKEKNLALAPLQFTTTNKPDNFITIKLWMIKDPDGWHLIDYNSLTESLGDIWKKSAASLEKRLTSMEKKQREARSRALLDNVITITPPITLPPPSKNEAKTLITRFRNHLRARNTKNALAYCAVLTQTSASQILKTLNYSLRGAIDHINDDITLGINTSGNWSSASIRTRSQLTKLDDYPLYLIINTHKGPRILLDIDLRHATNKGRQLINKKNWKKLEKNLPKESLTHIQTIFGSHTQLATTDIQTQHKLHE